VDTLLREWEEKELALLHILHAAYSKKKDSTGEEEQGEDEGEDDTPIEREMRIAAQRAHVSIKGKERRGKERKG